MALSPLHQQLLCSALEGEELALQKPENMIKINFIIVIIGIIIIIIIMVFIPVVD